MANLIRIAGGIPALAEKPASLRSSRRCNNRDPLRYGKGIAAAAQTVSWSILLAFDADVRTGGYREAGPNKRR
jgi:hypothetical protein